MTALKGHHGNRKYTSARVVTIDNSNTTSENTNDSSSVISESDSDDLYLNDSPPSLQDIVNERKAVIPKNSRPTLKPRSHDKKPATAAAAAASSSSISYPVILQTLLDDEDIIVGSGDQLSLEAGVVEDEQEEVRAEVQEQEVQEPETEVHPKADENKDEEEYEVVENTSDILGYFRDVPRKYWSCCMLGKLAGEKGFHCHAAFYAARISTRNSNRAHNNKMLFHGRNSDPYWGVDIMVTFERCIANHADDFHKCCYASAIEKKERYKWHFYRNQRQHLIGSEEDEESSAEPIGEIEIMVQQRSRQASSETSPHHRSSATGTSLHKGPEIQTMQTGSRTHTPAEVIRTQNSKQARKIRKSSSSARSRRNHKRHRGT